MPKEVIQIRYIFDIYSIQEIINGTNNRAKAALFDGLQRGYVKVLKNLSEELKNVDEQAYAGFQAGRPGRCYIQEQAKHYAYSSALMEEFGGNFYRANPSAANFLVVAVSAQEHAALVAHGKGHTQCQRIIDSCDLADNPRLLRINDFLNELDEAA